MIRQRSEIKRRRAGAGAALAAIALCLAAALPAGLLPFGARAAAPAEAEGGPPAVLEAPDMTAALDLRWDWALQQAQARRTEAFWIAYALEGAFMAGQPFVSDSGGAWFGGFGLPCQRGTPLRALLNDGAAASGSAVLLFRFAGSSEDAIDRLSLRSETMVMDFGGLPVFWLGMASDQESAARLETFPERLGTEPLQAAAVRALRLHASSPVVVPALGRVLANHGSAQVRAEAVEGLECHPGAEALELAVAAAENDASVQVRREAVETIGAMARAGAAAHLSRFALESPNAEVRMQAAESLGDQPQGEALPALERIVFEAPDLRTRNEGVESLSGFGDAALPLLQRTIWEHPFSDTRAQGVETLGEIGTAAALALLEEVIELHEDFRVVDEALDAIQALDAARARALLLRSAELNPLSPVRREAVERLGEMAGEYAIPSAVEAADIMQLLERLALSDPDRGVREEAAEVLEELREDR